jgi:hypothetical protein
MEDYMKIQTRITRFLMKSLLPMLVLGMFLFTACESDDPAGPSTDGVDNELTIDASSRSEWVYFSFSKGETVTVENPSASTAWDLKLMRYHLGTNSGTSGSGQGGAIDMGNVAFDDITQAPANGYAVDDSVAYESHGGTTTYSVNPVLETWAAMEGGMPPTFVPSNHPFCVKTADGKYAKVWLKSYYDAEGNSGHITIQYYYQPDGSKKLSD